MKKVILSIVLLATIGFTSCKTEVKSETKTEEVAKTQYYCPMECEGDKTYTDKNAKCPVCKMALVEHKHEENN